MNLGPTDEDELRDLLREQPDDLSAFIPEESRPTRERFLGDPEAVGQVISVLKAIASVASAVGTVATLIKHGKSLVVWARGKLGGREEAVEATPSERVLALLYFAYAKNRSLVQRAQLVALSGLGDLDVGEALERLSRLGSVRRTKDGGWKFNP